MNSHFSVIGEDDDISNLCEFSWYEWSYYCDHNAGFPFQQEFLGRVLGPAKVEGNEILQWIFKVNGLVVPHRTDVPLTNTQLNSETNKNKRTIFYQCISKRWVTSISSLPITVDTTTDNLRYLYGDPDKPACVMPKLFEPIENDTNKILDQQTTYNLLIYSEVMLPHQYQLQNVKILC